MAASRPGSEAKKSVVYTMIILIVLFLAAAVFAIMFYAKTSQYLKDKQDAEDKLDQIVNRNEYNAIKALGSRNKTAVGQITDDVRHMVQIIAGDDAHQ